MHFRPSRNRDLAGVLQLSGATRVFTRPWGSLLYIQPRCLGVVRCLKRVYGMGCFSREVDAIRLQA